MRTCAGDADRFGAEFVRLERTQVCDDLRGKRLVELDHRNVFERKLVLRQDACGRIRLQATAQAGVVSLSAAAVRPFSWSNLVGSSATVWKHERARQNSPGTALLV